ncbi:MAG: DUF5056 domain-containing protein [Bacteroidaceae bacterium]|nr:DUF5056 domain-containing protein [Bacteroidaceae bacterium]
MDRFNTKVSDEQLIINFFDQHREPIEDNGFTSRVLNALPLSENSWQSETIRLRRWSLLLNVFGVAAGFLVLIYFGGFSLVWDGLDNLSNRLLVGILTFDYDNILVQAMLYLHRLPDMLPSSTQLLALVATILILTFEGLGALKNRVYLR